MYSVVFLATFATAPESVDCRFAERVAARREHRASAGCHGAPARQYVVVQASGGCTGTYNKAPVKQPTVAVAPIEFVPAYRTPVRSFLFCPNGRCPK